MIKKGERKVVNGKVCEKKQDAKGNWYWSEIVPKSGIRQDSVDRNGIIESIVIWSEVADLLGDE